MRGEYREPSFSSTDAVDVAEYPRVNRAAVMALLLGLVSAGALANPLLWFLPLAGIVLAIIALRLIARSDEAVLGRRAALIGLVLSLVFITWAASQHFVRQELLYRQAREHAEYWLGLVLEGRLHEAHQLTLAKDHRQSPNANLNEMYLDKSDLLESFEAFCDQSPMSKVIELGSKGRMRFVSREGIESDKPIGSIVDIVTQQFAIDSAEGDTSQTIPLAIGIAKSRLRRTGEAHWVIKGITDPSELKN